MYLAKVHIAPEKAANPYELHRALWELFPDMPDEQRQFLFRVEQQSRQSGAQVLLQTEVQPISSSEHTRCLACKSIEYRFGESQSLRFRLRANPVKSVKDEGKGTVTRNGTTYVKSVRVPLIDEEQQQQWLAKKLNQIGAQLSAINVIQETPLYFRKSKEKRSGKIQSVLFEGILQVTDPVLFAQALRQGIGPAKSFGMGLLSVAAA